MAIKSAHDDGTAKLKGSIVKRLVMTYSIVLGVFLVITMLLLYVGAHRSIKKTIVHSLEIESAMIEVLYRERVTSLSQVLGKKPSAEDLLMKVRTWLSDVKKLAGIGFYSDVALILEPEDRPIGIYTPGETSNEIEFRTIEAEVLSRNLKSEPYLFTVSGSHKSFLAVSRPLTDSDKTHLNAWIIVYSPIHDLDDFVRDVSLQGALALGVGLLASVFLSYHISLKISKPIKTLKDHAEKIASRDFDSRVSIDTGDEIESLAQAMNKIAGDLKSYDLSQKRFLQNVSHELKTPIMSIMGYAEGLRDGVIQDKEKALHVIISECERLQRMVSEVLYLTNLETVEAIYALEREKLNGLLMEIREKMQPLMDSLGIRFELKLDKDCIIHMDRDKLMQAILNLLSNAMRYSKGLIVLETKNLGRILVLQVWDNGGGMDEKELQQVFERFYKGKKGSTGQGMTIAKAIIEGHKGSITVENHPEGGALFTIRLPIASAFPM